MTEFGDELRFTYVMGGLARDYEAGYEDRETGIGTRRSRPLAPDGGEDVYASLMRHWLDRAGDSGMPIDPRLWTEGPIRTTYPACMAVKAAAEQLDDGGYRYLRALREGLMCFRRKLDTSEALVEEARGAELDVRRFRIDLESNAIVESFGADLEATRSIPQAARTAGAVKQGQGGERLVFPTWRFGDDGWVFGIPPYEELRTAAIAAGAEPGGERPDVPGELVRFGRMATAEVEAVCGLPRVRAEAELWALAADWRARALPVLTGTLWEPA